LCKALLIIGRIKIGKISLKIRKIRKKGREKKREGISDK